jgi:hypothetical protein
LQEEFDEPEHLDTYRLLDGLWIDNHAAGDHRQNRHAGSQRFFDHASTGYTTLLLYIVKSRVTSGCLKNCFGGVHNKLSVQAGF